MHKARAVIMSWYVVTPRALSLHWVFSPSLARLDELLQVAAALSAECEWIRTCLDDLCDILVALGCFLELAHLRKEGNGRGPRLRCSGSVMCTRA